jgi:hypothetical protein
MLELHHNYSLPPPHDPTENGNGPHYSPPRSQSPPIRDRRQLQTNGLSSRSHSPPYFPQLPSMRDTPPQPSTSQRTRKRHRSSRSPSPSYRSEYESSRYSQELPPSPSESSRSDSAECSPRSRTSMAIGSLLSSGPGGEVNGDDSHMSDRSGHNRICVTNLSPALSI